MARGTVQVLVLAHQREVGLRMIEASGFIGSIMAGTAVRRESAGMVLDEGGVMGAVAGRTGHGVKFKFGASVTI